MIDTFLFYFATCVMWLITHPAEFFTGFFAMVGMYLLKLYYVEWQRNRRRAMRSL